MGRDFSKGPVGKKLLFFALPIIAGMLLQTAYNVIDTIFIGLLGPKELAAASLTFPVVFVFIAVASGLGIGATSLISQALGKKNIHQANNFAEHALILGMGLGIAIALLGILFSPSLFTLMGADQEVLALTIQYSTPIFIGLIFMFAWFVSDSILKAQGNSKAPMKNLAVSVAINIALDPIMIFGFGPVPALGLTGAALATVFSRIIAAALNFMYIYTEKSVISLSLREFKANSHCVKSMISVGLPASASQTLTAAGFMLLMGIVGSFGSFALAAFGVGIRITSIIIMPIVGISMATVSFVGQNIGAKRFDRAARGTLLARRMTLCIAIAFSAVTLLFPEQIMRVFSQDPTVIAIGISYLGIAPFGYVLLGAYFVFSGAFQGTGRTDIVLATNIAYWATAVGFAYLLSQNFGLRGIWVSFVIAAAVELAIVSLVFWSGAWLKVKKVRKGFACKNA